MDFMTEATGGPSGRPRTLNSPDPAASECSLVRLRRAAVALVVIDLVLLVLALGPAWTAGWSGAGLGLVSLVVSLALIGVLLLLLRNLDAATARHRVAYARMVDIFDALPAGIVLYDSDDRVLICNRDFVRLYADDIVDPRGARFEDLLRAVVGAVPEALGREGDWLAERLRDRSQPATPMIHRLKDGSWQRIVEQRLADGKLLSYSMDISSLKEQEQALEVAREEAEQARRQLADAVEALPATFELYDAQDHLVLYNTALARAYPKMAQHLPKRLSFEELALLNFRQGGQPEFEGGERDWLAMRQGQREASAPGASVLMRLAGGGWLRHYETRLRNGGLVAIRVDVTDFEHQRIELVAARREAELATHRLHDAIELLPAGFELYDAEDRLILCNAVLRDMYSGIADLIDEALPFESLVRINHERGGLLPELSAQEFEDWMTARLRHRRSGGPPEVHLLSNGRWIRTHERLTRDGGLVGVRIDISELMQRDKSLVELNLELERVNAELSALSETDPLTGLANRRQFDRRLAEEWSRAVRHDVPLSLLMIDVDHFKAFNDRHGHGGGDLALQSVARVLREAAARPNDLVARLGGEEFAILLPHQAADEARVVARKCIQLLDETAIVHGASPGVGHLSVSVGVADMSGLTRGAGTKELLAAADAALYAAKRGGRHQVAQYQAV